MAGPAFVLDVVPVTSPDVIVLVDELSALLLERYGSDGRSGFVPEDEADAVVVVARRGDDLLGCGAVRRLPGHDGVAEVKRMYARPGTSGVGGAILRRLEAEARTLGCGEVWLETRRANVGAIGFYRHAGYDERPAYGRYIGRPEAICLGRCIGS